jgi:hypothetical protein
MPCSLFVHVYLTVSTSGHFGEIQHGGGENINTGFRMQHHAAAHSGRWCKLIIGVMEQRH